MGENQEILFAKTLEKVKKQAKEQQNCISQEQVREAFADLALSKEQLDLVFDYLKKHKIGIGEPVDLDEYLSQEETDYLEEYKKGILYTPSISDGEREAFFLSAMAGERQAQQEVIALYLPQVAEVAKLYTGQGVFLEDLIGEGNLALTMGVTMLGALESATEAEGMLMKMVMDAMEDCIAENLQETDKDKKVAERVNQVAGKAKELAGELHRKVSARELAVETGMSVEEIEDAMRMSGYTIEDLER